MTEGTELQTVRVDVVSDVICPWCFIGKRRFDRALAAAPHIPVEVRYRPFLLDPSLPAEGMDREEYLSAKFPDREAARRGATVLEDMGRADGIEFAFDRIKRTPNTLDAHRLIGWAHTPGVQPYVVERLFERYFLDGADISEHAVLLEIAREAGLNIALILDLLNADRDKDQVVRQVAQAYNMGVSGVPTFILNAKYGLVGAQDPAAFVQVLETLAKGGSLDTEGDQA